jgi:methyltransferase-like protein
MVLFHESAELNPAERVRRGRELLSAVIDAVPQAEPTYAALLRQELELLSDTSDTYFLHEELESENHPVYFADFARCAGAAGLEYVCEANPSLVDAQLSTDARAQFRAWSASRVQYEQYLDFARNRTFRRSILCHANRDVAFGVSPDVLPTLWLSARCFVDVDAVEAKAPGVEVFRTVDGVSATLAHPMVRAALHILSNARPSSMSFAALLDETRRRLTDEPDVSTEALPDAMLRCALVRLVDLTTTPAACAAVISACPVASPLARFEARHAAQVSSLGHVTVTLAPFDRFVIQLLDGTRDAANVVDEVIDAVQRGALDLGDSPTRQAIAAAVDFAFKQFKLNGLLVA